MRAPIEELRERLNSRTAVAGVIGLGYVGLPLSVEIARRGLRVMGFEKDAAKVAELAAGRSYISDVASKEVAEIVSDGRFRATTNAELLAHCDVVSVCVPTPLGKTREPDMRFVISAAEDLAAALRPGMLVLLESTTYPGTTDELILPMLSRSGLEAGKDFFLCFSPERIDPGNPTFGANNIPKVVGGVTPACTEMGRLFYSMATDTVVPVSSARVAETAKLLENTFRMLNIGLANEMAMLCRTMGIDVWEVIEAAATKPFGFMPFYPGPGLGGHCIPVDPFYLSWKSKQAGGEPRLIELAGEINARMPNTVVSIVQEALNDAGKPIRGSRIHVVGVAYKKNVSDTRESPALDIIRRLRRFGGDVVFSDAFTDTFRVDGETLEAIPLAQVRESDCVILVTDHDGVDYAQLVEDAPLIVDTRNRLKAFRKPHIVRL
ncbi:MAG: nucleotide sugar dehydrogenase [Bryobacterales bacterium]